MKRAYFKQSSGLKISVTRGSVNDITGARSFYPMDYKIQQEKR